MGTKLARALVAAAAAASVIAAAGAAAPYGGARQGGSAIAANVLVEGGTAGTSVAAAGDVNGDGRPDLVVGAPALAADRPGVAYVVFGRAQLGTVELDKLGAGGFRIEAAELGDGLGWAVAGAGDVDGDELADVIVGAPFADPSRRENAGSAYVVFGKESSEPVRLAALGDGGFRIDGVRTARAGEVGDSAGRSVGGGGDVNGDGLADVILGAPFGTHRGRIRSGAAYVVFGRAATTAIDLAQLGSAGRRIEGAAPDDGAGDSVAVPGDVNRDGFDDVVLGAPAAGTRRRGSGAAYVVFGTTSTAPLDLASLGGGGISMEGAAAGDFTGMSVAGAGDVNGDSYPDVVVGAPYAAFSARRLSGAAYVVFGRREAGAVDLAALGASGLRIGGSGEGEFTGYSVSGAGDVNGDERADLVLGAPEATPPGRPRAGVAYVVVGRAAPGVLDLASLGAGGYRIDGAPPALPPGRSIPPPRDATGASVAGAGDVDGDGLSDVLVGAPGSTANGFGSGGAYVVRGSQTPARVDLASLADRGFRILGPRGAAAPPAGTPPPPPGPPHPALPLRIRRFSTSPARPVAGGTLTAVLVVARVGSSQVVAAGRMGCRASVGGRNLRSSGRFSRGTGRCTWRLPSSAAGKVLRGTVTVTSGTSEATRRFTARIRAAAR